MFSKHDLILTCLCTALVGAGCGDNDPPRKGQRDPSNAEIDASQGGESDAAQTEEGDASSQPAPELDAGLDAAAMPQDADTSDATKSSRPGVYTGYSERVYRGYELSSQYVAVRDGTKLAVDLYRPKQASGVVVSEQLPVIWMHTPYNRRWFRATPTADAGLSGETYPGAAARLVEYGYVVAVVDFRGLYASYGKNAAYNRGEWVEAARNDAYDITEWLAQQSWSSGQIGMWGCSATGGSQLQAATTAPPHLKAIFPMSCEFDAYPFGVPGGMAPPAGVATRPPATVVPAAQRNMLAEPVDGDSARTQLNEAIASQAGSFDDPGYVPFRDSISDKVQGVRWWTETSPHSHLEAIERSKVAVYLAANWDEAATKHGAFFSFNNLKNPSKLVVGPATHCAWFTVQRTTGFDISIEELRFFDHWLKGIDNGVMREPKVYYYTYNAPMGQEWRTSEQWPLKNERRTPYYLGADNALASSAPSLASAADEKLVDYEVTPATIAEKGITYTSAALTEDLQVTGHPTLELWVSSSASDADFIATLQDLGPGGEAVSYNVHGRLRASHRKVIQPPYQNLGLPYHPSGSTDATPLVPGEPARLDFELLPTSQIFKAGHRIRLVITFAELSTPRLMPAPSVKLYRDATHPSALMLPVIPGG
ncbi:MAG TPA: CocE/NonD family hydrolase [Polyangiaceae bacterium]|nr:CocE/NonD family hydrolase [Polyangiaceae bacterium]